MHSSISPFLYVRTVRANRAARAKACHVPSIVARMAGIYARVGHQERKNGRNAPVQARRTVL
ncbi:hypothetical protein BPSOL_0270 [Bifidobacterium pseudolongum]|nr:hypothetical protein BPSOL_0270 [Bifidobacterium pseudolongum]